MFWFNVAIAVLGFAIIGLTVCGFLVDRFRKRLGQKNQINISSKNQL